MIDPKHPCWPRENVQDIKSRYGELTGCVLVTYRPTGLEKWDGPWAVG